MKAREIVFALMAAMLLAAGCQPDHPESVRPRARRRTEALSVAGRFGRAPLCFYVLHIFLYAGLGHLVAPRGTTIPIMHVFWLLGLLILFPLCLWYGRLKHRQPAGSFLRLL